MSSAALGVTFKAQSHGKVSTTQTGKAIWSAALQGVNDDLATQIRNEQNWRKHYVRHVPLVTITALQSPEQATTIARQGLDEAYRQFEFTRDGRAQSLAEAMRNPRPDHFHSVVIHGRNPELAADFELDYRGQRLRGNDLNNQLDRWVNEHIIEADFAELIKQANRSDQTLDLRGQKFVLFGASSEMGPVKFLLNHGADVIAVDLGRKHIWQRLMDLAQHSAGSLTIPVSRPLPENSDETTIIEHAGADLMTDTPEIAAWLQTMDGTLNIGSYAYLDAANHVRVVMAMDAIVARLLEQDHPITLSYLMTPTDVYTVSESTAKVCQTRQSAMNWRLPVKRLLRGLSLGRWYEGNIWQLLTVNGRPIGVIDSLVVEQGPNYNLAKRIQRWRAIDAVQRGIAVSCNVAPSTSTHSVTKNRVFAAGFAGAEQFGVEVFQPATANTIMALAMTLELRQMAQTPVHYQNPEELFMRHACHGGLWAMGNQLRSILVPAVIIGFVRQLFGKH